MRVEKKYLNLLLANHLFIVISLPIAGFLTILAWFMAFIACNSLSKALEST